MKKTNKIIDSANIDFSKIDAFLIKEGGNNVFQSFQLFETFTKIKNYKPIFIVVEDESGEIQGVLLAVIQKQYDGFMGFFTSRSVIIGGPVLGRDKTGVLDLLLNDYNIKVKTKVIYSQFRNLREFSTKEKLVFDKNGYSYEPHLDILHNLNRPLEELWMDLHKGRRKNIRRSERMNVSVREIENDTEFMKAYKLVKGTYKRVKLPMPDKSLFLESYNHLSLLKIFKVFIAIHENEIISARMVLCYNNSIYDWYAGASENHMDKYPNDILPWKIMEWGCENGFKSFDFGGAGKPNVPYGVRDHKLKFGGELVDFGRFQLIHNKYLYRIIEFAYNFYRKNIG